MADVMRDIVNSINGRILVVAGSDYKELAYLEDVQQNSFRTSNDRYGTRALASSEVPGVTKFTTYTQTFEVVLTKGYIQSNIDDTEQVDASLDNRALMLDIYTDLVQTHAGLPGTVLNVTDLIVAEPEYLESDKVAVQRSQMSITYRLSLL